jgi:hypothetical protein
MGAFGAATAASGKAIVNVFDGTRKPYSDTEDLLITVRDGNQKIVSREFHDSASVEFPRLKVFDNFGDNYTFLASAKGYKDAGFFPVRISADTPQIVDLMLVPKSSEINFARWSEVRKSHPLLAGALSAGAATPAAAEARYNEFKEEQGGAVLACLLNITAVMAQTLLPQRTALHYLKMVRWELEGDSALAQDRFFGWADPGLIQQIEQAKTQKRFADAPPTLHPGATRSYKQIEFGEANVQFTFHENDRLEVDGVNCVMLEADMDYFKDTLAHLLLEVAVNALGDITDPRTVYALRWIAGRRAGVPEFEPPYTLRKV